MAIFDSMKSNFYVYKLGKQYMNVSPTQEQCQYFAMEDMYMTF